MMKFRQLLFLTLLLPLMALGGNTGPDFEAVGKVIDDFHDAAAHGDKQRYFGHLTNDAVYLGTDEWERWPKHPDFDDYVDGRFKDGSGWTYKSRERECSVRSSSVHNDGCAFCGNKNGRGYGLIIIGLTNSGVKVIILGAC